MPKRDFLQANLAYTHDFFTWKQAAKREEQTEEERARIREQDRRRRVAARQKASEEERDRVRSQDRQQKRRALAAETDQQREERLERDRLCKAASPKTKYVIVTSMEYLVKLA